VTNLAAPKDANLPVHGIDVLVGYHGNQLRWYDDLLGGPALTHVQRFNARFLNLAGTRYLINPTQTTFPPDHFGDRPLLQVGSYGNSKLLRNDNAFPRVFLVDRYQVIVDRDAMVNEVLNGSTDMRKVVLLEEEPALEYTTDSTSADSTWIIDYQPESVLIGVETSQNKLLVLTDTWFPAWQVSVDGSPAKLLRSYGAFRAVEIPAGGKQVQFVYHSERYLLGRTVSWLTALYLLGIIGFSIFRDRRRQSVRETAEEETEAE